MVFQKLDKGTDVLPDFLKFCYRFEVVVFPGVRFYTSASYQKKNRTWVEVRKFADSNVWFRSREHSQLLSPKGSFILENKRK